MHEGHTPPSSSQISQRAGVSAATLFRYFPTLDDLQHEATSRYFERNASLFEIPALGRGSFAARVERFVAARALLYERTWPVARFGRARSFDQPHFAAALHEVRMRLREQAREQFATELSGLGPAARDDLVGVVSTVSSFESWEHLRRDLGRSPQQIRRAWRDALSALLG